MNSVGKYICDGVANIDFTGKKWGKQGLNTFSLTPTRESYFSFFLFCLYIMHRPIH